MKNSKVENTELIELTNFDNSSNDLISIDKSKSLLFDENLTNNEIDIKIKPEKSMVKELELIKNNEEIDREDNLSDGDAVSEVSINDLGTYDLKLKFDSQFFIREKSEQEEKEIKTIILKKKEIPKHLAEENLIDFVNGKNPYDFAFKPFKKTIDIIFYFSKEINEYSKFKLIDPFIDNNKLQRDPNSELLINEYKNTNNSFIALLQKNMCFQNKYQEAIDLNIHYKEGKKKYEVELILKILENFKSEDRVKQVTCQNLLGCYEKLRDNSKELLKTFENWKNTKNGSLAEIQENACLILREFIIDVMKENERENKTAVELKRSPTYTAWKKKFSELINIWELYTSNGIDIKFSYKYLILKKFFLNRAFRMQNKISVGEEKEKVPFFDDLFLPDKDIFKALAIYQPNSAVRTILQTVLSFAYIYTCFTIALRFWIPHFETREMDVLEGILDILFFIDMIYSVRTVYRDESNNDVQDLKEIFVRYTESLIATDLITIFPWEGFLKKTPLYNAVKQFRNLFKLLRINKIGPFLSPIETTSMANIFRLVKLVLFFLVMSVWFGSIIIYSLNAAVNYDILGWPCYDTNMDPGKTSLKNKCAFLVGIYQGPFVVTGQLTSFLNATTKVAPTLEYFIFIFEFSLGILINTYVLGGITEILKNLNQGENFFIAKTDMLTEHMVFYDVSPQTQVDLKVYYDYLWQRHKDIIYGKLHFAILSRSLRERFEILNLPKNKLYLAKFYNLNLGSNKLVGKILMNLNKKILFPYEILFEEGSVAKGLYFLLNGDILLVTVEINNVPSQKYTVDLGRILAQEREKEEKEKKLLLETKATQKLEKYNEEFSVIFPLTSVLLKTGRIWQRSYSEEFSDLLFLSITTFDDIVQNFPIEISSLKHDMLKEITQKKTFDNEKLFKMIATHSSRSQGTYYEKEYNKVNIWIPIPIPISQRKIAKNYVDCFVAKVRNLYKEINLSADLNITLQGYFITLLFKNNEKKNEKNDKKVAIQVSANKLDKLEQLRNDFSKVEELIQEVKKKKQNLLRKKGLI